MIDIPAIETERLRLRGPAVRDFESLKELWAHPEVTRFTTGEPQTPEQTWSRLLRSIGHWTALDFGLWIIEDKPTSECIGESGFADLHGHIEAPLDGMPETGWILHPSKHGKGYATEAVKAVLNWGHQHWGHSPVACLIRPEHTASLRVAEKCGFTARRPNNLQESTRFDPAANALT